MPKGFMVMIKVTVSAVAFAISGCAAAPLSSDASFEEEDIGVDSSALASASVPTTRVYFGHENCVTGTYDVPWVYGQFDLKPGAHIGIYLAREDSKNPELREGVGFKLYSVRRDGS